MLLPEQAQDQEISNRRAAEGLAYADRPVAIEPGLSTDIAPISLMVVKLAIQELLKDQKRRCDLSMKIWLHLGLSGSIGESQTPNMHRWNHWSTTSMVCTCCAGTESPLSGILRVPFAAILSVSRLSCSN